MTTNKMRKTMKLLPVFVLLFIGSLLFASACSTSGQTKTSDEQAAKELSQVQAQPAQAQRGADQTHHPDGQMGGQMGSQHAQMSANRQKMMEQNCPMQVSGTTTKAVKLDGAVGLDFTTTGDVDELRQRVGRMAQMHQQHRGQMMKGQHGQMMKGQQGHMMKGQDGQMMQGQRGEMMQMMANTTTATEEIQGGMRLKLTPKDASELEPLHQMMQKHAQMMDQQQGCPMMMQMMGGGPVDEPQNSEQQD